MYNHNYDTLLHKNTAIITDNMKQVLSALLLTKNYEKTTTIASFQSSMEILSYTYIQANITYHDYTHQHKSIKIKLVFFVNYSKTQLIEGHFVKTELLLTDESNDYELFITVVS